MVGRLLGRLLGTIVGVLTDQLIVVYGTVKTPTTWNIGLKSRYPPVGVLAGRLIVIYDRVISSTIGNHDYIRIL